MANWLSVRGTGAEPLPRLWLATYPGIMCGFATPPRGRPRIVRGDRVVWYATGFQVVYGLATVLRDPELRQERAWQAGRWPWWIATRTEVVIADLHDAPSL